MSVKLAEGVVEVKADASDVPRQISRDIDGGRGGLEDAGRRSAGAFGGVFKGSLLGSFMGNIASDIVGQIGYAIGTGIRAAVQFGIGSVNLAGSLEQSIGAVDAVFGGSAGQIHEWATGAAGSVGLTRNAYSELATVLGSQLKNGGTAIDEIAGKTGGLITLGADMSAMFGGTTADAVGALSAALRGERDTIERYGVSLTQAAVDAKAAELGFEKVDGVLSQQATQAATLALVYDQTAAAQGRFAAEGDTFAGKQARLAASFEEIQTKLGTALLPALTTLSDFALTTLIPLFDDLVEKIGPQLGGVLEEAAPAFVGMFEAIAPHLPGFIDFVGEQLPAFLTFLGDVVEVGAGAIQFFEDLGTGGQEVADAIRNFFIGVGEGLDGFDAKLTEGREQTEQFFADVGARFGLGAEQIGSFFGTVGEKFTEGGAQIGTFGGQVGTFFSDFGGKLGEGAGQIGGFIGTVGAKFSEGGAQIGAFVGVVGQKIGEAVAWIAGLPGQAGEALGDLGSTLYDSGASLIQGFIDGISDMIGNVGDAVAGVVDWAASFFPNSPARRGPLSGSGWTAIGKSGLAIGEQFASGIEAARDRFGIPFTTTAGASFGGGIGTMTAFSPSVGSRGETPINLTINEAKDPLGSAGRVAAELRKWKARG